MLKTDKNINAKIYVGKDARSEILFTIENSTLYTGDSTRGNDEFDFRNFRIPNKLDINSKTGLVFIPGGVFGTQQNFLKFDENRNTFYIGENGFLTNSINVKANLDYVRNSDTLKINEDEDFIKTLVYIVYKKLEEESL